LTTKKQSHHHHHHLAAAAAAAAAVGLALSRLIAAFCNYVVIARRNDVMLCKVRAR